MHGETVMPTISASDHSVIVGSCHHNKHFEAYITIDRHLMLLMAIIMIWSPEKSEIRFTHP